MRGFAGFFIFPDPSPDAAELLARLGSGVGGGDPWLLAGGCAGLTGARLARSEDGRLAVAFDGTIYNRAELGADGGASARAEGDAGLFLALYQAHGAACVERLRGPFAVAMWEESGACLLARDPMGLRSLYYFQEEATGRLMFATGVRPLAASGVVPRQLDARGLYGFFRHGAVPEPSSMVAGVHALETGGRLAWQAGKVTRDRVSISRRFAVGGTDPAQAAKALRAALLDSVDAHLADGATQAVFAGGGMGSAALLALAREMGREKNLRVLTLGFDDAACDETDAARRLAEHFGLTHRHLCLDRERARTWFDDFLPGLDQPGIHGFPLFALGRLAREEGVNVALAGVGAGELFGDLRFHARLRMLLRAGQRLGRARAPLGRALLAVAARPSRQRLADFFTRPPTPAGAYAAWLGIHTAGEARALVARFTDPTGCADPSPEDAAGEELTELGDQVNALELRRRLRDQRLRDAEASGRAHGLEWRLPFVDRRVMEALAQLPAAVRLRGEHWCPLREAMPEIPAWVTESAGGGMRFPPEAWQVGDWGAAKPTDAAGSRKTRRAWEQKWSLFLFRRWWRQFASG